MEAALPFKAYEQMESFPSIQQLMNKNQLEQQQKWVMTEKIHGANFSFIYNGSSKVVCARRNAILQDQENFFGFQAVKTQYENDVVKLFNLIKKDKSDLKLIRIYGQLYGGTYPGEQEEVLRPVFWKVKYCPQIDFELFDVAVEQKGGEVFLDYFTMTDYVKQTKIPYALPLRVGPLQKIMEGFDIETFQSTIYEKHQLPMLPQNNAEGVVLKTFSKTGNRLVIQYQSKLFTESPELGDEEKEKKQKSKNPQGTVKKTQELNSDNIEQQEQKEEQKKVMVQKTSNQVPVEPKTAEEILAENLIKFMETVYQEAIGFVNNNRLNNVLSKMTQNQQTLEKISTEVSKDAWQDFVISQKEKFRINKKYKEQIQNFQSEIKNRIHVKSTQITQFFLLNGQEAV